MMSKIDVHLKIKIEIKNRWHLHQLRLFMVLSLIFFCSKKLTSQMVIINFCIFHISVHKVLSIFLHNGKQPAFFVQRTVWEIRHFSIICPFYAHGTHKALCFNLSEFLILLSFCNLLPRLYLLWRASGPRWKPGD